MHPESTCWTLIRGAAGGNPSDREQFARLYEPVVRAYLAARWRGSRGELADAVQEVFLACFQPEGVLERADPQQPGGFRAFLYGVARNVARRVETRRSRRREQTLAEDELVALPADEESLSRVFDRAWATVLLEQVIVRLRDEHGSEGKRDLYEKLKPFLMVGKSEIPYARAATDLNMSEGAVRVAVHRLRKRYRELLREEIAQTLATPAQAAEEMQALFSALAGD